MNLFITLLNLIFQAFTKQPESSPNEPQISPSPKPSIPEITIEEYLMNRKRFEDLTPDQQINVQTLLRKVNAFMQHFGEYRGVNSGIRTIEDHKRIYAEINAKRKKDGLPPRPIPMGSKHLSCQAVDLEDADGRLKAFCLSNTSLLEQSCLWFEAFEETPSWLHCQTVAPASGNRIFKP